MHIKFRHQHQTHPTRIGIIGIGSMGKGIVFQSLLVPGIKCVAVADINMEKCINSLESTGQDYKIVHNLLEMHAAIGKGTVAICEDGELLAKCEMVDILIEASNSIIPAAHFAIAALRNNKHLILVNSEIDLILGPYLLQLASQNNLIYTSGDGDQYGVIKHLIDEIQFWGFQLVMAGNMKGFLNRYANPTTIVPEAEKRNLNYKMCTSYTDGTKLSIEMALVANAFNLNTVTPGMIGPPALHVQDVLQCFNLAELWKERKPFVDYILGAQPNGGVFVVGYCDNAYQRAMLEYYKMGKGPYYVFYRPYHLCHIEVLATVKAVEKGMALLQPSYGFRTNVYAYSKRNLKSGEILDGIGGYSCYGLIENQKDNIESPGLPICIADDVVMKKDVEKDQKIFLSDIEYQHDRFDYQLYFQASSIVSKKIE
jgi:predicted homoserine dehydrogenase-like protein